MPSWKTGHGRGLARLEAVLVVLLAQLGACKRQVRELVAFHSVHAPGVLQRLRRRQAPRRLHVQQAPYEVLCSAGARPALSQTDDRSRDAHSLLCRGHVQHSARQRGRRKDAHAAITCPSFHNSHITHINLSPNPSDVHPAFIALGGRGSWDDGTLLVCAHKYERTTDIECTSQ